MDMLINGTAATAADETWIEVKNPATGEYIDKVPRGSKEDVNAAVETADAAFGEWSEKTTRDRGLILCRAAELIRRDHKDLARLLTQEQGKPIRESTDEIRGCANILEYYASIAGQPDGEAICLGKAGDCLVTRVPLGVCAAIIPWNMPVIIMGWKVGPALLAGNTLVLKPSSATPLTNLKISGLLQEAGLPAGVLNVVTGPGETTGAALVQHPRVKKISFTGDGATGRRIREMTQDHIRTLTLELGGSDPMIVMADADIPKAVEGALGAGSTTPARSVPQSNGCTCTRRSQRSSYTCSRQKWKVSRSETDSCRVRIWDHSTAQNNSGGSVRWSVKRPGGRKGRSGPGVVRSRDPDSKRVFSLNRP